MKKIVALLILSLLCWAAAALAGGTSVWNETVQLYSSATGTTNEVNSSAAVFQFPVKVLGCDVSSSATTTVNIRIEGHEGYLASFPTSSTAAAVISQSTCTWASCFYSAADKPLKVIRAVISTPVDTTSMVRVTCTGIQ